MVDLFIHSSFCLFIEPLIQERGLLGLFNRITTNPASWQKDGRLIIQRLIAKTDPPHNCKNKCAENICKGKELANYLATLSFSPSSPITTTTVFSSTPPSHECNNNSNGVEEKNKNYYDQIVYVGDSLNDLCPAMKMARYVFN